MNLVNILYEPYVIIIFISLIITAISYFIIKDKKNNSEEKEINIPLTLFYVFIASFLLLIIGKYVLNYMNKNNFFQKGGITDASDRLTIIDDDVDIGLIDE